MRCISWIVWKVIYLWKESKSVRQERGAVTDRHIYDICGVRTGLSPVQGNILVPSERLLLERSTRQSRKAGEKVKNTHLACTPSEIFQERGESDQVRESIYQVKKVQKMSLRTNLDEEVRPLSVWFLHPVSYKELVHRAYVHISTNLVIHPPQAAEW